MAYKTLCPLAPLAVGACEIGLGHVDLSLKVRVRMLQDAMVVVLPSASPTAKGVEFYFLLSYDAEKRTFDRRLTF